VFFTGENIRPDFKRCDYAMTFDYNDSPRHYRLPLYALFGDVEALLAPKDPEAILKSKTKFCAFIYSNPSCATRNRFFKKLSKYKRIDSAGRYMNNMGIKLENKLEFIKDYKFTFAFENSEFQGYTTEKIFEPMLKNSIPLYWGNPLVAEDFNRKSFVNYYDFSREEEMIDRIIELDSNANKYYDLMSENYFVGNKVNKFVDKNNVANFLNQIVESDIKLVGESSILFSDAPLISQVSGFYNTARHKAKMFSYTQIKHFSFEKIKFKLKG
jgi:hypothetical protein